MARPRYSAGLLLLLLTTVLISGCGLLSGDSTRMGMSEFYNLYLPLIRTIPHPDSTAAEPDDRLNDVRLRWSVNHTKRVGQRDYAPYGFTSFATLLGRDLIEHSLDRQLTGDLSPDLQERLQEEQRERADGSIVFDVHLFVPAVRGYDISDTALRGAGASVILEVGDGERYRPSNIVSDLVEHYQIGAGTAPVYHRLNQVYFPREVDGRDILDDVESIRLIVRMSRGPSTELWFRWEVDG